jgi:hypothetical protein
MTLILTVQTRKHAVQVSDRRITTCHADGRTEIADDDENKAIYVIGHGCNFVASFTGLARVGTSPTADWLATRVSALGPGLQKMERIKEELSGPTIEQLRRLAPQSPNGRLDTTIVLAGYMRPSRVGKLFDVISFTDAISTGSPWHFNIVRTEHELVAAHGAVKAISDDTIRRIRALSDCRLFRSESGEQVADRLAEIMREAAEDPHHGKWIGPDCMSIVVTPNPSTLTWRHHVTNPAPTARVKPVVVSPILVFGNTAFRAVQQTPGGSRVRIRLDPDGPNLPPFDPEPGETSMSVIIPSDGGEPRLAD